ncbi:MAG: hypothetical protein P4L81_07060 [Candidatus Pacebacteria bacterium]|nr:hypothetical protein [Candidatus Paceibacterota bacterium]
MCEHSFLHLWTYPNLFKKPGKELVDLLVVFRDDIVLFSDKSCGYPDTGNFHLDWQRWYRRAIADSAHQLWQAERWIRTRPDAIFLDAKCQEPLPLHMPNPEQMKIHHVCVATGATERCLASNLPGLGLDVAVVGDENPLKVGRVCEIDGWLHIFDEGSINTVLAELNTMPDFIAYLNAKLVMLNSGTFQSASSEVDMLAQYLWNGRSFPIVDRPYFLKSGLWQEIEANAAFLAGRAENEISFFWDNLIEHITKHFINRTLEVGNELKINEYEMIFRVMASETRFDRRVLTKAIWQRAEAAQTGSIASLLPSQQSDVIYVLLIVPRTQGSSYEARRKLRAEELWARCIATKAARPEKRFIIGIALDAPGEGGGSEDFVYLDTIDWGDEQMRLARRVREESQYFIEGKAIETPLYEEEYPGGGENF